MKLSAVPVGLNMPIKGIKKLDFSKAHTCEFTSKFKSNRLRSRREGRGGGVVDNAGFHRFFF